MLNLLPQSGLPTGKLGKICDKFRSFYSRNQLNWDLENLKGRIFTPKFRLLIIMSLLSLVLPLTKQEKVESVDNLQIEASVNSGLQPLKTLESLRNNQPLKDNQESEQSITMAKADTKQVFGFAPYWTFDKLENIDFNTLTTLAYFDVEVSVTGDLVRSGPGYQTFISDRATELFKKAHAHGTRVVLTVTQMQNRSILAMLDNEDAQRNAITQIVDEVQRRGIDGVNVDLEYSGNPGVYYRHQFNRFVENLTAEMHRANPDAKVTVSVYAISAKEANLYDIAALGRISDGIFMMAYDFTSANSDVAMPTAPLYGHKEGRYWYDVSTAVEDFLAKAPAEKLILGVPWYGMNFPVSRPEPNASTLVNWGWRGVNQTYGIVENNITPNNPGLTNFITGWDEVSQVGWKAYYAVRNGTWRMIFSEDSRSFGAKIDFAKSKNLAGVGMWALGFEDGRTELWDLLREKFGSKLADASIQEKPIYAVN